MTMDSWFSDPSGGNGEDTSALWAQEEADKKKREEEYQAGPLPGQGLPPPPSGAAMFGPGATNFSNYPPVTAPPVGDLSYTPGINPIQGGFRQTELQPTPTQWGGPLAAAANFATDTLLPAFGENLQKTLIGGGPAGGQLAGLPSGTTYQQGTQAEIPYAADINQQLGNVGQTVGNPVGLGGVGRFVLGNTLPENIGDAALMAGLAGTAATPLETVLPFDPLTAVNNVRGGIDNVFRAGMPEPNLGANLSGGLPPPGSYFDPFGKPPISAYDPLMEVRPPDPAGLAFYGPPQELPPELLSPKNAGQDAYDTGAMFGYNPAAPDYTAMPSRLATAPPDVQAELRQAEIAANEDAAMVRGMGQTPPPAPVVAPPASANEMQTALDNARALENAPAGTGAAPPPAEGQVVRIAVQPDALRPLEDFVAPGKGFEITDPSKARILGPSENVGPGETLMLHGTGNAGIQGDLRTGINVTNDPVVANSVARTESRLEGMNLPSNATPTPFEAAHQQVATTLESLPTVDPLEQAAAIRQLGADGAPPRWGQPPAGEPPTGGGKAGGASPTGGTPQGEGAIRQVQDALYVPFGFDLSSTLRQDAMRTMNPFRIGETFTVAKDAIPAIGSRDAALRIGADLKSRAEALGVNMHLPDWQGADIVGRENLYSKLLNNLPGYEALNRGFATEIASRRVNALESFAKNHVGADLQHEANRLERITGRGSLGSGGVEKALSNIGPAFTALRYTLSIPQRTASLIPFQRLTDGSFQMFGPSWRESVIDHAGFATTVFATMAAAQQAGLKVGWDPNNQTSNSGGKTPFGKIELPNGTLIDLTGGASKYVNAVVQLATGEKNGKDYPWLLEQAKNGTYKGTVADFIRNLSGPTVQFPAAALKMAGVEGKGIEFMRPDFWDKGVTGKGTFADKVAQFVVPLWVQDVADAVRNSASGSQLPSQVAAGAAAFFGAGVQTYEGSNANPLTQMRNDALSGSSNYYDLMPHEQQALDAALQKKDPEGYAKAQADAQSRQDPAIRANQQARDTVREERNSQIAPIVGGVVSGQYDPGAAYRAIKEIQDAAAQKTNALLKDPAYLNATKDFTSNDAPARRALDTYYAIPNTVKGPDGKVDWTRADQLRAEMIASIAESDPGLARRLLRETETSNLYEDLKKLAPQKAGVK